MRRQCIFKTLCSIEIYQAGNFITVKHFYWLGWSTGYICSYVLCMYINRKTPTEARSEDFSCAAVYQRSQENWASQYVQGRARKTHTRSAKEGKPWYRPRLRLLSSVLVPCCNNAHSSGAASTTTQFDAETLDAVSAAYCTTHHLTSMESLWEKSGKTKTTFLQSYYESWSNSQDITLITAEDVWIFATSP